MEKNQFEISLVKHQQAMEILIEDFNAGLSVFKQNQLSRHIALLKQQNVARHRQCKEDFEEALAKIQKRKNATTSKLALSVFERAEASLRKQYEAHVVSIKEFCQESIAILMKL
jgi:hypothetical protein